MHYTFKSFNLITLIFNDFLHKTPDTDRGHLHHVLVKETGLGHDVKHERLFGGLITLIFVCFTFATEEIVHWVDIIATGRHFSLYHEVIVVLLQPGQ